MPLGNIMLDVDPSISRHGKGHSKPHFSAHVCCDHMVAIAAELFLRSGKILVENLPLPTPSVFGAPIGDDLSGVSANTLALENYIKPDKGSQLCD